MGVHVYQPGEDWTRVEDDLPPLNTPVLACGIKRLGVAVVTLSKHGEWSVETCSDACPVYPPRWWRALPKLPKEKQ